MDLGPAEAVKVPVPVPEVGLSAMVCGGITLGKDTFVLIQLNQGSTALNFSHPLQQNFLFW